jgi:hypothetical protein
MERDKEMSQWTADQMLEVQMFFLKKLPLMLNGKDLETIIRKLKNGGKGLKENFLRFIDEIERGGIYSISFDGSIPAEELLEKCGQHHELITNKRFPIKKHELISHKIELVDFESDVSTSDVLKEFERRGLERPAIEDAFYFSIKYPREQLRRNIIFFHEPVICKANDYMTGNKVLTLAEYEGRRVIGLHSFRDRFSSDYTKRVFAGIIPE